MYTNHPTDTDSYVARFLRTDLACEAPSLSDVRVKSDDAYFEYRQGAISVARLTVENEETAARFGKPQGTYVTVTLGDPLLLPQSDRTALTTLISAELRRMAERVTGKPPQTLSSILVAGLGNAHMTADALGPRTVRGVLVTRHLQNGADGTRAPAFPSTAVAAVAPGVLAETGIETVELIRGAANTVRPDLLIAVDALAARSIERLATTVQLSDTGLNPGSGVGNRRKAIDRETVGCPVIALGVPTVVDSSTLVWDALYRAGFSESDIGSEITHVLESGRSYFVSPKEIDALTEYFSDLLAESIDRAFSENFTTVG